MSHDPHRYRPLFPVCESTVYLDHAAVAACSSRTRDAVVANVEACMQHGIRGITPWIDTLERARDRAAALIGARPDEIAFVRSTSHGLSLVAEGLAWEPGDEVVVCSEVEYPSNVFCWRALADRGVRQVAVPPVGGGVSVDAVAAALTPRTRLVSASSVQFATGHRTDVDALGALCRERGILLCVDGIQSVGAFPLDVHAAGIHFLAADSHKWMLGLLGVGILYVDRAVVESVRPVLVGWRSQVDMWSFAVDHFELPACALRFEEGSLQHTLIDGLDAAFGLLLEAGIGAIGAHISGLLARAEDGLTALGCEVSPPRDARAGILMFTPPDGDATALHERLMEAGFTVSLRRGRIRISPHLFNTREEIDRLVEAVAG